MSKILQTLQDKVIECRKMKLKKEVTILQTVIGEAQSLGLKNGKLTDDDVVKLLKKFKAGVEETLKLDPDNSEAYYREIAIYEAFIPIPLSVNQIVEIIESDGAIKTAPKEGPAIGLAMKTLKELGLFVDSKDVIQAVKRVRA